MGVDGWRIKAFRSPNIRAVRALLLTSTSAKERAIIMSDDIEAFREELKMRGLTKVSDEFVRAYMNINVWMRKDENIH
jgi:hypothetical protein